MNPDFPKQEGIDVINFSTEIANIVLQKLFGDEAFKQFSDIDESIGLGQVGIEKDLIKPNAQVLFPEMRTIFNTMIGFRTIDEIIVYARTVYPALSDEDISKAKANT